MTRPTTVLSVLLTACLPMTLFAQVQTIKLPAAPVTVAPVAQSGADAIDPVKGDPVRGIIVQGGREDIGPKQDDPGTSGIIVQGGREAIGPKQDDPLTTDGCTGTPGVLAIGPKQDDPGAPGALASRPDDDNDPKASTGMLAIGPKQDDPRAPGIAAQGPGVAEAGCMPDLSATP